MSSESVECPLCMEPMDFDDVDFFPCPCRYQICRFCWYKIINEENGLCPACRKPYNSEHPASYKPRTEEEIKNKLKSSKKVCPKKGKPSQEGKEYLSEYRVLQKNLIFVVGLPMRMADEVELLKGSDYFGKCGKVYKIVINQNQTFPGPQGTSCLSAYVTYHRNEDALKTLVDLKKLEIDGRAVKLSLGTTKYCSQFLRNRKCTKQDCMYLHEMGDQAASFTKEDMANGKHTEYENQLIQEYHEILKLIIVNVCVTSSTSTTTAVTSTDCVTLTPRKPSLTSISSNNNSGGGGTGGGGGGSSSGTSIITSISSVASSGTSSTLPTPVAMPKCQRPVGLVQMTPIGTDPNDASKLYIVSDHTSASGSSLSSSAASTVAKDIGNNYHELIIDNAISSINAASHNTDILSSSLNCGSPLSRVGGTDVTMPSFLSGDTMSNSLLESFYQLNSQSQTGGNGNSSGNSGSGAALSANQQHQQQYDHSITQQTNNNGVLNYCHQYPSQHHQHTHPQQHQYHRNDMMMDNYHTRLFGCSDGNSSKINQSNYEHQKFKDMADIDFDPINVSRQALAEMIASENRQKMVIASPGYLGASNKSALMSSGPESMYGPSSRQMLRSGSQAHDFLMQQQQGVASSVTSVSNNDFFAMNSRAPGQPFIHDKPSPGATADSRLSQQLSQLGLMNNSSNIIIPSTSSAVQSISSGFPSPPPGFEVAAASNNNGVGPVGGDPSSSDIMSMLLSNQNSVDMYPRYQNQHSSPDLQCAINHNQYNNQFPVNYNCQNQISTGSNYHNDYSYSNGGMMFNDINSQSLHGSHSWKNAQSAFCEGPSDISHAALRSSGYNRSHSMNENSVGIRNSDWNGFSSYTSPNDSQHLSGFQDGNFSLMPMRVQSVQCAPSNVSGNDPQLFSRQQTSHSVNH